MGSSGRKYSGHAGLGAELRRLRGGRTLQQIFELSSTPPLADRIKSVAVPTLSLIENGVSMPTLDTLYSLSVIYKVPMQRLYEIVGMERMVSAVEVPETLEEAKAAYSLALSARRYHDAVALAGHVETALGRDTPDAVHWRACRAAALSRVGMQQEAVALFHECIDHPSLPADKRYLLLRNLGSCHVAAGQPHAAVMANREALRLAPATLSDARRLEFEAGMVAALLVRAELSDERDEGALKEAREWIRSALPLAERTGGERAAFLRFYQVEERRLSGNLLLAAKEYQEAADGAVSHGDAVLQVCALRGLALVRRQQGDIAASWRALQKAESAASLLRDPTKILDVAVEMLDLARSAGRSDWEVYLRRCERHAPLVMTRTVGLVRFERLLREIRG